jgi:hypothetical protein
MKDAAVCIGTIAAFELLKFCSGASIALAVAGTTLICCLAFLWHAGKEA